MASLHSLLSAGMEVGNVILVYLVPICHHFFSFGGSQLYSFSLLILCGHVPGKQSRRRVKRISEDSSLPARIPMLELLSCI